jgi:hypothetical protein
MAQFPPFEPTSAPFFISFGTMPAIYARQSAALLSYYFFISIYNVALTCEANERLRLIFGYHPEYNHIEQDNRKRCRVRLNALFFCASPAARSFTWLYDLIKSLIIDFL